VAGQAQVLTVEKTPEETFRNGKIDISLQSNSFLAKLDQCPKLDQIALVRQGIAENPSTINRKTSLKFKGRYKVGAGVFVRNHPAKATGESRLELLRGVGDRRRRLAPVPGQQLV
jgi:hypothetical protein